MSNKAFWLGISSKTIIKQVDKRLSRQNKWGVSKGVIAVGIQSQGQWIQHVTSKISII